MGLAEILGLSANVTMRFKADTSDMRAQLKGLTGEERKAAEAAIKLTEAENKRLENKAKNYQLAAQAIGGVSAAVGLAKKGLEAYAKTSLGAEEQVKKMSDAAGKAFDGIMQSVGKTVVALEPLISNVAKLVSLLNDAGVAGPAAIGALGFAITGNPVVAGLLGVTSYGINNAGKGLSSQLSNQVSALASGRATYVYDARKGPFGDTSQADLTDDEKRDINYGARLIVDRYSRYQAQGRYSVGNLGGDLGKFAGLLGDAFEHGLRRVGIDQWAPFDPKAKKPRESNQLDPDEFGIYGSRRRLGAGRGSTGSSADPFSVSSMRENAMIDSFFREQRSAFDATQRSYGQADSWLEHTFGPIEQFDVYKAAFQGLGDVVSESFGAWIDGTAGLGEAAKNALAGFLKNTAIEAAMNSLKSFAQAATYAATPGMQFWVPGALKAGALWAALAAATGGAAHGLGGGSSGGGGGASAGGYRPSAPYTQPMQTAAPVIVVGSPYAYDSPRNQQRTAKRLVSMVTGTSAVEYG